MLFEIGIEVYIATGKVVNGKRLNEEYAGIKIPFVGDEETAKKVVVGLIKGYEEKARKVYGKGGWSTATLNDRVILDGAF